MTSAGKSSVILDVKPWDDETDMKKLEEAVRSVQMEGLTYGACKLLFVHLCSIELNFIFTGSETIAFSSFRYLFAFLSRTLLCPSPSVPFI